MEDDRWFVIGPMLRRGRTIQLASLPRTPLCHRRTAQPLAVWQPFVLKGGKNALLLLSALKPVSDIQEKKEKWKDICSFQPEENLVESWFNYRDYSTVKRNKICRTQSDGHETSWKQLLQNEGTTRGRKLRGNKGSRQTEWWWGRFRQQPGTK